jgi:hypothetical protein
MTVISVLTMLVSVALCAFIFKRPIGGRALLYVFCATVALTICQIGTGIALYDQEPRIPEMLTAAWDAPDNWQRVITVQNELQCCGLRHVSKGQKRQLQFWLLSITFISS